MASPKTYFISDLHLGHENIVKFSYRYRKGSNVDEHDEWLIDAINSVVHPKDNLWMLGDVSWGRPGTLDKPGDGWHHLSKIGRINGTKNLILGNHDDMGIEAYTQYFNVIRGFCEYKGIWLSHAPIHPEELRGNANAHGHVHENTIDDPRYLNVCVEENMKLYGVPVVQYQDLLIRSRQ